MIGLSVHGFQLNASECAKEEPKERDEETDGSEAYFGMYNLLVELMIHRQQRGQTPLADGPDVDP